MSKVRIFILKGGMGNQLYIYSKFLEMQSEDTFLVYFSRQLHSHRTEDNISSIIGRGCIKGWAPGKSNIYRLLSDIVVRILLFKKLMNLLNFDIYDGYYQDYVSKKSIIYLTNIISEKKISNNKDCNNNSLGIHIRRGDYVNNSMYYSIPFDWYIKNIKYIINKNNNINKIIISSNDIDWCKKKFEALVDININNMSLNFLDSNNSVISDMVTLSNCNYLILSNSTLSFWIYIFNISLGNKRYSILPDKYYTDSDHRPFIPF